MPAPKKPKKAVKAPDEYEIELEPEAWEKFEKLVKQAAKMGPKPHVAKPGKKRLS